MKRTLARELAQSLQKKVLVRGWMNNLRLMGKIAFLLLRDRTGLIQIVVEEKEDLEKLKSLQPGSILKVVGTPVESGSVYKVEIKDPQITIENGIYEAPPIEFYKPEIQSDLDFILDHRPVALRNRQIQAVFRIKAEMAHAFRLYMHDQVKAVEYFSPNIIGASSEGGAEFFNVDYFGYTATLAQSSQLYKQIMVGVNERVFALMPFFRAEPSQTTRHISEGRQFEFEMGFFDSWHEIMDIQESCIKYMLDHIDRHSKEDLALFEHPLIVAPKEIPFPRLTFQEAQEHYFRRTGIDERKEPDLSPAAERELSSWALENHGTEFVFVTDWKKTKRPFYAYPNEENPELTNTYDLISGGVEITSGGQRRHTYQSMVDGIREKGMDPDQFSDYLSIFQYGMPLHGGFGMGLERLTLSILKLKNIREASLFPSDTIRIAANRIKANIIFGGENLRGAIIHLLRKHNIRFEHLTHEPTPTSEDSARVRGVPMSIGIKAMILRGKHSKKNYQINIPAHLKIDMKAVALAVGEKCEFEDPAVIKERFGLEIGSVPPFGNLLNLASYYDEAILLQEKAAFNCGLTTESIVMKPKDLVHLVEPILGHFTKN